MFEIIIRKSVRKFKLSTHIFTMGTITIAEVVEVSKSESESPKAEAPKEDPKEPSEPEVPELPKEEPVLPEVPLIPEEEIEEIVLPEPILVVNSLSMNAEVIPEKEKFINGEDLTYKIKISNDGDLDLYNITVADDLGLEDTISILSPGEEILMNGSYPIDLYNELEKIGNSIDISAKSDGENLSMNLSFIADIEIPKGSITILNSVDKALDRDTEFDIFIEGPNDTEYTLSLKAEILQLLKTCG